MHHDRETRAGDAGTTAVPCRPTLLLPDHGNVFSRVVVVVVDVVVVDITIHQVSLLSRAGDAGTTAVPRRSTLLLPDHGTAVSPSAGINGPLPLVGPIPWGHSGPLCHALSLSLSMTWTSMRRRRATVPLAAPGEWA